MLGVSTRKKAKAKYHVEHELKIPSPLGVGAHQPNQLSEISLSRLRFETLPTRHIQVSAVSPACLPVSSVHFGLWFSVSVCQRRAPLYGHFASAYLIKRVLFLLFLFPLLQQPRAEFCVQSEAERQIRRMTRYITGIAFSSQHTELIIYIWLSVRRRRNPSSVPLSDLTHSGKDLETLAHILTDSRHCAHEIYACLSSRFF